MDRDSHGTGAIRRTSRRRHLAVWLALALTGAPVPALAGLTQRPDERSEPPPAGPRSHPVRGGFLPLERLADRIANPRKYKVRLPPPGYSWVHVDRDLVLVQDHSGLIVDVVEGGYR